MVPDAGEIAKAPDGADSVECIELMFKSLTLLFTWQGFANEASRDWKNGGSDTLLRVFRTIASKTTDDAQDLEAGPACYKTFMYFYKFKDTAPTPAIVVALLQLLESVYHRSVKRPRSAPHSARPPVNVPRCYGRVCAGAFMHVEGNHRAHVETRPNPLATMTTRSMTPLTKSYKNECTNSAWIRLHTLGQTRPRNRFRRHS
jgi:hypothetical protein